jgi:hypothetical protein
MTREEFKEQMLEQIEGVNKNLSEPHNVLDLRAVRFAEPNVCEYGESIFSISEIDDAYSFVCIANEWFVDIYENFAGENYAEFTDKGIYHLGINKK